MAAREAIPPNPKIDVPPKYTSADFISSGGARYWALRGKLDVPKERWVSFPHCEGPDGTLVIAWAGYDHLQLARAISAYFVDIQERLGGRDDSRLIPLWPESSNCCLGSSNGITTSTQNSNNAWTKSTKALSPKKPRG